jgi:polysaccharide export outer membrane protein
MRCQGRLHSFFAAAVLSLALFASPVFAQGDTETPEYRIGPEDILQIQAWSRPDLSGQVAVDLSGDIHVPLLDPVHAAGRTPTELGKELTQRYGILDANISDVVVSVVEYRSRTVTVVGEVRNPGRYSFPVIPNVWDVILNAGGATPSADLKNVQIVRKEPAPGEEKTLTVDLSAGLEGIDPSTLPVPRPKDTLIVPSRVGQTATGETFQVIGAVRTPGIYPLSSAGTVVEALALSGGPDATADLSHVRLTRPTDSGVAAYDLDVRGHLYSGRPAVDLKLKEGDTVTVPARGGVNVGAVLSEFLRLGGIVTAVTSLVVALR